LKKNNGQPIENDITDVQLHQFASIPCHYIIISAIKKPIQKYKHHDYRWRGGDHLVHWQLQLPTGNIQLQPYYSFDNPVNPIPANLHNHVTFYADVTYDHSARLYNKYHTADVEVTYHPRIWTSLCLAAICIPLQTPMSANDFVNYINHHNFFYYLYDKYGFGCRTWTTRVASQLCTDGHIQGDIHTLINNEADHLLGFRRMKNKKQKKHFVKVEVQIYEVPDETAKFFTYAHDEQLATIID
jgi:hypothetical protein